jgi:hypothetical protein
VTARDVTIIEKFPDEDKQVEEPEYLAQWESDSEDDSIQVKHKRRTPQKQYNEIQDQATEVKILEVEPEEEALFATPPTTPQTQPTQPTQPAQPAGENQLDEPADIEGFLDDLNQEDLDDLATEQPIAVPATQPIRRTTRSTARPDYKALSSGRPSKKLTMVALPSERQVLPPVLALSTIKAIDFQRDQNGKDQSKVPKSYHEAKKGPKWEQWKPAFEKQMRDLESRNAWDLVYPPPNAIVLPGRWVLDMKFNALGAWERNRALGRPRRLRCSSQ